MTNLRSLELPGKLDMRRAPVYPASYSSVPMSDDKMQSVDLLVQSVDHVLNMLKLMNYLSMHPSCGVNIVDRNIVHIDC